MSVRPIKVAGVAGVLGGVLLVLYSVFGTERREHEADLGPVEIQVVERDKPSVSPWVGIVLAAIGAGLLALPSRR